MLNAIHSSVFIYQYRLKSLMIDANEGIMTIESKAFVGLNSLINLQLVNHRIDRLSMSSFVSLTLEQLTIYKSEIQHVEGLAFEQLRLKSPYLNTKDIHSYSTDMFKGLESLQLLVTDEFQLCCIKPEYLSDKDCFPHSDAFSSCFDLIRNEVLISILPKNHADGDK